MDYINYLIAVKVSLALSVTPTSQPMIGDSVSISCSVTLPGGVVGTQSYEWAGPGGSIPASGPENVLNISTIRLSQAGQYICTVNIDFFSVSNSTDIIVESE